MKVLIVNTHDEEGGAARAARRLHKALQAIGVSSEMFVQFKLSDDYTIKGTVGKIPKALAKLRPTLDALPLRRYPQRAPTLFSPAWLPLSPAVEKINAFDADIVHIHWTCDGFLRPEDFLKIKAPIVWSLHDNWAFTGGCHIKWECQKFKQQCGACPRLGSDKDNDLSRIVWERKKKVFDQLPDMKIIGLSKWLADEAKNSSLLARHDIINIPNPLDTQVYKPMDKKTARDILNLPNNKKLVLFGAMQSTSDINKGFHQLQKALMMLQRNDVELVVFGSSKPQHQEPMGFTAHFMGRLYDDVSLRVLYSAADVMIVPSLQENLSNTIMESLACGTPVVAFATGGNGDLIEHQVNGYLAAAFESQSLAEGINWVLNHDDVEKLSAMARQKVEECFSMEKVAAQYKGLYENVIENAQP